MSDTMLYRVIEDVGLVLHAEGPPSVTEWNEMLKAMDGDIRSGRIKAVYVYTLGGAPSPTQRKALTELYNNCPKAPQVAVVTPKAAIRAVVTVINWFQRDPTHRVFAPSDGREAFAFMGVDPSRQAPVEAAVQQGMKELKGETAAQAPA
jgi:hypothetical protein